MSTEQGMEVPVRPRGHLEMSAEEMRRLGYLAIDLVVDRLDGLESDAAWRGASRRELEPRLAGPAPAEPRPLDDVMRHAAREILPYAARTDHPRFFAFVPSAPNWAARMAEVLASGFSIFQGTWLASGGPSTIELTVLDWFREWLGMPEGSSGIFTSGGSAANLIGIVAALEHAGRPPKPSVFFCDQGHSALFRAARIAGVPEEGIHSVPSGPDYRMDLDALDEAIRAARAEGRTPVLVGANGGATNTGVVDPLDALADRCGAEDLWFHVDGAYGGFAVLTDVGAEALRGIERADSVVLDPHKWLFQTFECGCLMVRDPDRLHRAFAVSPEYLQDARLGREQVNFGDRGLQLSRSFRSLKVWMTVQTFGLDALRRAVQHGNDMALEAERLIEASPVLEVLSPARLSVVCYRFRPDEGEWDEAALETLNTEIQKAVIESEFAMVSSTRLHGRYSLRFCFLNDRTNSGDVRETLARVEAIGRERMRPA